MKRYICVFISDVPTFIGQNRWNVIDSFERLYKRVDCESYNRHVEVLELEKRKGEGVKRMLEKERSILDVKRERDVITDVEFKRGVEELEKKECETNKLINDKQSVIDRMTLNDKECLSKQIGEDLEKVIAKDVSIGRKYIETEKLVDDLKVDMELSLDLKERVKSFVNKSHGIKNESFTLERYEKDNDIILDRDQKFYSKEWFSIETDKNEYIFKIGGKMDGIDYKNRTVIEIKNRVKRLFKQLREYEKTQLSLYMEVLGFLDGILVEMYKDKTYSMKVKYNKNYIEYVKSKLKSFAEAFVFFIESCEESKLEYMNSSRNAKEDFIWNMIDSRLKTDMKLDESDVSEEVLLLDD